MAAVPAAYAPCLNVVFFVGLAGAASPTAKNSELYCCTVTKASAMGPWLVPSM